MFSIADKDSLANLATDANLKDFNFLDFLLHQLSQDRKQRLPAKKLLKKQFLDFDSMFVVDTTLESLNNILRFSTSKTLKVFINSIKSKLLLSGASMISLLLSSNSDGYRSLFEKCCENALIAEAATLVKEGKKDRTDLSVKDWLFDQLTESAERGETETVKMLCEAGAQVNRRQIILQRTALHIASEHGHASIIKYLVKEAKSDVNAVDLYNNTALHLAAEKGHFQIVTLLCQHNAEVDKRNSKGETALHGACWAGHFSTAEFLIGTGASVNQQEDSGFTPLHEASRWGHVSIIDLLLKNGADTSIKDGKGRTARDVAGRWYGNEEKKKKVMSLFDQVSSGQ